MGDMEPKQVISSNQARLPLNLREFRGNERIVGATREGNSKKFHRNN